MTDCTENIAPGKVQGFSPSGIAPEIIPAGKIIGTVTPVTGLEHNDQTSAGEPAVCPHSTLPELPKRTASTGDPIRPKEQRKYQRGNGCVFEAMEILAGWNFAPARFSNTAIPVDIIAFRKSRTLLAQVIYSRTSVPDAKTLTRDHRVAIDNLRRMGTDAQFRKIVMVWSFPCGWKYYDVLPGGLIPAWNLPGDPEG